MHKSFILIYFFLRLGEFLFTYKEYLKPSQIKGLIQRFMTSKGTMPTNYVQEFEDENDDETIMSDALKEVEDCFKINDSGLFSPLKCSIDLEILTKNQFEALKKKSTKFQHIEAKNKRVLTPITEEKDVMKRPRDLEVLAKNEIENLSPAKNKRKTRCSTVGTNKTIAHK